MQLTRRPRATGVLLALVLFLALLGPGAAGRAATVADAPGSLLAGPAAGPEQGFVHDRPGRSLVVGGTRDHRERPAPALPGVVALAVAAKWTVVAALRAARPGGHHGAVAGARAPPSPQLPAAS
jgi:hypothetical protein